MADEARKGENLGCLLASPEFSVVMETPVADGPSWSDLSPPAHL